MYFAEIKKVPVVPSDRNLEEYVWQHTYESLGCRPGRDWLCWHGDSNRYRYPPYYTAVLYKPQQSQHAAAGECSAAMRRQFAHSC